MSGKVFDAVAAELAEQEIWISLDNHVSKAQWCCGADDGNTWFGGTHLQDKPPTAFNPDHQQTLISTRRSGCAVSDTWQNM
jgi:hypothetical protein